MLHTKWLRWVCDLYWLLMIYDDPMIYVNQYTYRWSLSRCIYCGALFAYVSCNLTPHSLSNAFKRRAFAPRRAELDHLLQQLLHAVPDSHCTAFKCCRLKQCISCGLRLTVWRFTLGRCIVFHIFSYHDMNWYESSSYSYGAFSGSQSLQATKLLTEVRHIGSEIHHGSLGRHLSQTNHHRSRVHNVSDVTTSRQISMPKISQP